jgi:hypothetical protein
MPDHNTSCSRDKETMQTLTRSSILIEGLIQTKPMTAEETIPTSTLVSFPSYQTTIKSIRTLE